MIAVGMCLVREFLYPRQVECLELVRSYQKVVLRPEVIAEEHPVNHVARFSEKHFICLVIETAQTLHDLVYEFRFCVHLYQQLLRAEFIGSPMMVAQLDTTHYNQVAGKQMTAHFRNNEIYRNDVNGNVQTIYYMQDGEPPQITDVAFIDSGDASFYIEDKQVITIVYRTDPDWNISPLGKVPPDRELYLKGFHWEGARRPSQGDVFDRTLRPSRRTEIQTLPHPDFPLMRALEERKKLLIEERRWTDRFDQVDPATVEWMHSLGFEVGQPRQSSRGADAKSPHDTPALPSGQSLPADERRQ